MEPDSELRTEGLRDLLATDPDLVLVIDRSGVVRYMRQLHEEFERSHVMDSPARNLVHPSSRRVFDALLECTRETGETQERELLFGDQKGRAAPFLGQTFPLCRNGTVESVLLLATKVREKGQQEGRLDSSQEVRERCAWCGRIRIRADEWKKTDSCPEQKAGIPFTHGLCPDCYQLQLKGILKGLSTK